MGLDEDIMDYGDVLTLFDKKTEEVDPEEPHITAEEFEIEAVVDHEEIEEDDYDYYVKWQDWEDEHNTWHSQEDLKGCEKLIQEYWTQVSKPAAAALGDSLVMSATAVPHTLTQVNDQLITFMSAMDKEEYEYPHICATITEILISPCSNIRWFSDILHLPCSLEHAYSPASTHLM